LCSDCILEDSHQGHKITKIEIAKLEKIDKLLSNPEATNILSTYLKFEEDLVKEREKIIKLNEEKINTIEKEKNENVSAIEELLYERKIEYNKKIKKSIDKTRNLINDIMLRKILFSR
jgi:predicted phage tail protein